MVFVHTQSSEVKSSYHMEKEGLNRALKHLQEIGLEVGVLVTDRHKQIKKWVREEHSQINHYFDVWHIAKGELQTLSLRELYDAK